MFSSPFGSSLLSKDSKIVFVSDLFLSDYTGGAELTSQALIDSSPYKVDCIRSKDVSLAILEKGHDKFWIFGNFAQMNLELIPTIVANMNYSVLEYDYKFCKYRSPEKHRHIEAVECNCAEEMQGKLISTFYHGAKSLWFMSEKQMFRYKEKFPTLNNCSVLSSVFDESFFEKINSLKSEKDKKGWIVLGSSSWIKGAAAAENWCIENSLEYEVVWGLEYNQLLERLATAEGFVYLPEGGDTCPRMVIEAKLLGCKLHLNDYVEHKDEIWFNTDDDLDTLSYLYAARERFWNAIKSNMEQKLTISGYTTTKNCIEQGYPWEQCIQSMLGFANEVVVVDGGSTDGTYQKLTEWAEKEKRLKVFLVERDWNDSRFAVFDGLQKAEARARCTSEFLWQQDADEVVHELDYEKIIGLCRNFPRAAKLVSLPVLEYWGNKGKIRCDINPWKWRLSLNDPDITHGIPLQLRKFDSENKMYALQGTDGCDYISKSTGDLIPHANFHTAESETARVRALSGDPNALQHYSRWFQAVIDSLPGVHHYSWFDLPRKINTYKNYWQTHWESLYDIKQEDTAENNKFFNKPWSKVSDKDIEDLAVKMESEMGGWIFHTRIDFNRKTPHLEIKRSQPLVMKQ